MIEINIHDNGLIDPEPQRIVETPDDFSAMKMFERYLTKAKFNWNLVTISVYSKSGEKISKTLFENGNKNAIELKIKRKVQKKQRKQLKEEELLKKEEELKEEEERLKEEEERLKEEEERLKEEEERLKEEEEKLKKSKEKPSKKAKETGKER